MPDAIRNKAQMYERYLRGEFGNRLAQWPTLAEVPLGVPVGVREVGAPGGLFVVAEDRCHAIEIVMQYPDKRLTFSEVAPDEHATLFAEATRYEGDLVLCGALGTGRCERFREAMVRSSTVRGLRALNVLREHAWPDDAGLRARPARSVAGARGGVHDVRARGRRGAAQQHDHLGSAKLLGGMNMETKRDEALVDVGTGSTRSKLPHRARHDLVPTEALHLLAERFGLGAATHGERNWQRGQPFSVMYAHALEHLLALRTQVERGGVDVMVDCDTMEENLGAILWFGAACAWFLSPACPAEVREVFFERKEVTK